ncbi:MAG: glycosyltransferase family 4 protein [Deltaproteobacteria bacterium]|nr:glycosyltransferase family 4 protein [Deltaproteobacteria bacterium]
MEFVVNSRFLTQPRTGVQRFAIEISQEIQKQIPEAVFVSPGYKKIGPKETGQIEPIVYGRLTGHLWEQAELPRYLRARNNPLLVNLTNSAPSFYPRKIVTIHDLSFLRHPEWFSRRYFYLYRFLTPRIARHSLKIVTVSEFSKKEIIRLLGVPEEKVAVVYNAPSQSFTGGENLLEKEDFILSVCSFNPRKNIQSLIEAFTRLKAKGLKLIIAGSWHPSFRSMEISEKISHNANIIFKGHVADDELLRLYKRALMLVYPSFYEGFGLPPVEAMACGCPVVVSNTSSLPEVCGDAACYVDPYQIESITEAMKTLLDQKTLRQDLIQRGFQRAKAFSWEESARQYLRIIRDVLDA